MTHWADKIAKEIIASGKFEPYWVDDMTTPSGYSHIGSIRGPIIHDLIYKVLLENGKKAKNTYVFNDFDPIDGLPPDLQKDYSKYLGFPLRSAPSPAPKAKSFGEYFSQDFKRVILEFGIEAEFLSSWDLYHEGKFNEVIVIALDNTEKIQNIYQKIAGSAKKESGWLPFQVICESCGKLGTTRVFAWDGKEVSYKCEPELVTWAKGCGHEGKISPFDGRGKLPWKVDWPAHWRVLGVTIEGAGKDHSSAGGSYDIAMELCREVFKFPQPYKLPYEHFLLGGKKMSSSMGIGLKARDWTSIVPASVGRFLFVRTDYGESLNFNPLGNMIIPDLFDEYDKAWEAYDKGGDEKLARTYVLSQVGKVPEKEKGFFAPRFRDVANYLSQGLSTDELVEKFTNDKKGKLDDSELDTLEERIKYAKVWLEKFAPEEFRFEMTEGVPKEAKKLTVEQKKYLGGVVKLLEGETSAESLQVSLYELSKEMGIGAKEAFAAIYLSILGKTQGPRAGIFLSNLEREKVVKRLMEVSK